MKCETISKNAHEVCDSFKFKQGIVLCSEENHQVQSEEIKEI